jgi:hypothetical protein
MKKAPVVKKAVVKRRPRKGAEEKPEIVESVPEKREEGLVKSAKPHQKAQEATKDAVPVVIIDQRDETIKRLESEVLTKIILLQARDILLQARDALLRDIRDNVVSGRPDMVAQITAVIGK